MKNNRRVGKRVEVSLVGESGYPPKTMEDYRYYRIEYGGSNKECLTEGGIWLPIDCPPELLQFLLGTEATEPW